MPLQCVRAGAKRGLPLCARAQQQQQQPDKVIPGSRRADTPWPTHSYRAVVKVRPCTSGAALPSTQTRADASAGMPARSRAAHGRTSPSRSCYRGRGAATARVPACLPGTAEQSRPTVMAVIRFGREHFVIERHFNLAERKAKFRHLQEHCFPQTSNYHAALHN